jgi:hypothetical protein
MGNQIRKSIVTSGLKLYLDATSRKSYPGTGTTWFDLSGNAYNGVLTNGVVYNGSNIGVMTFDGVNDCVMGTGLDNASASLTGASAITINTWVKRGAVSAASNHTFIGFANSTGVHKFLMSFLTNNTINVSGRSSVEAGQAKITTTTFTSTTTWYNVVGVLNFAADTILCYVNGVSQPMTGTVNFSDAALAAGNGSFAGQNRIGAELASATLFKGDIGITMLYNRALAETEILQNFEAHRGRYNV